MASVWEHEGQDFSQAHTSNWLLETNWLMIASA